MGPVARRSLVLATFGHIALEICNNCLPVIYPLMIAAGVLTYTQVGTISLVSGMAASLTQPLFGHLSDRWDARMVVTLSVLLSGLAITLVGFANSWLLLLALVTLALIGSAAFHPSGATVAASGAHESRGAAAAIFSLGGTIGVALSPVLVALGVRWLGVRSTVLILPVGLVGGLLLYAQTKRTPHPNSVASSESVHPKASTGSWAALAIIIVAGIFRMWVDTPLTTYLPTWVQARGGSLEAGARTLFLYTIGTAVGSIVGGRLADRIGRWQAMAVSLTLLAPAVYALQVTPSALQVALIFLIGMMLGANYPILIVTAQENMPRSPGVATGLALGLGWIGSGVGGQVTGILADHYSLNIALRWLAAPGALALICTLLYPLIIRVRPPR